MKKLLLHHCCAPCSPNIVRTLKAEYELESFWFNPNIHPDDEYKKRKESLERFVSVQGLTLHQGPEYSKDLWLSQAPVDKRKRCRFCYHLRLLTTAHTSKWLNIRCFSTTLLASPYQDYELINSLGTAIAQENGLVFVSSDLRKQYFDGKTEAKNMGCYMQKYCGCLYSQEERAIGKKGSHANNR